MNPTHPAPCPQPCALATSPRCLSVHSAGAGLRRAGCSGHPDCLPASRCELLLALEPLKGWPWKSNFLSLQTRSSSSCCPGHGAEYARSLPSCMVPLCCGENALFLRAAQRRASFNYTAPHPPASPRRARALPSSPPATPPPWAFHPLLACYHRAAASMVALCLLGA